VALRLAGAPPARIEHGERVRIEVAARLNGLAPHEVAVELVLNGAARMRLAPQAPLGGGEHLYALEFAPEPSGRVEYRLRAYPAHELLAHPFETGLMTWL
jgi:starch phosphorylase